MTYVEDDPDDIPSNTSGNPHFSQILAARYDRRAVLSGGLAAAALGFLAGPGAGRALAKTAAGATAGAAGAAGATASTSALANPLIGFTAVPPSSADAFTVPPGYRADVLIRWGDPLREGGPEFRFDGTNTAAEQEQQFGMHHDGMHYFPANGAAGNRNGVLVINHEYTDRVIQFSAEEHAGGMTPARVSKALAGHGVSVVEVARNGAGWERVDSPANRRITAETPMGFSGPVDEDHPRIAAALGANPVRGTLNNCSHGATPWGTYLACEENWQGYFGTAGAFTPTGDEARYGVTAGGFGYQWHLADPRFDLNANRQNLDLFGWVVEIDPSDPTSTPVKRTALGRFKHEGATVCEARGHLVVYSGDDENGDYVYKYVSASPWKQMRARGVSPLDEGTLYVAQFSADGSGQWLPLVHGTGPLTAENGFADQAEVLLRTRVAADVLGATPLDRPEWVAVHPDTADVYLTLTNGSGNAAPMNPRNPNPYGHIIRWAEDGADNTATTFSWDIFLLAGDPVYDPTLEGQYDETNIFGSPDGIWIDDDGRVWVQTDISNSVQNRAAAGYDRIGNNMMLAADPSTGEIKRFLVGPRGAEITGVITTPDRRTMFVNVQHPGESTTAWGTPTPTNPRVVSNWPDFLPDGRPRSSTVVITKLDGGVIGTAGAELPISFEELRAALAALVIAGGIRPNLEAKVRHAFDQAEEWLTLDKQRPIAHTHLQRAVNLLLTQAQTIERGKPNQGDPAGLRALAAQIQVLIDHLTA